MADSSEDFLSEYDLEVVLAIFCCYEYNFNSSELVEKIKNRSQILLSSITVEKGWL